MRTAWRYVTLTASNGCGVSSDSVFDAIADDLLRHGNVDKALNSAFRLGFENDDGHVDGLRDVLDRLREDERDLKDGLQEPAENDLPDGEATSGDMPDDAEQIAERVQKNQLLQRQLKQLESLADLDTLDPDLVAEIMTDEEREWIDQWRSMAGELQNEGLVLQVGDRLVLTPIAIRRIGQRVLRSMFTPARQRSGSGDHESTHVGNRGTATGTTSGWTYGRPLDLDLARTVLNAIHRGERGTPVRLTPADFEIAERESAAATSTMLLIDMSRSMFYNGCWEAAKRSAIALDALIRMQFPRDTLEIIGFAGSARLLRLEDLPSLTWDEFSHGTNLQTALSMARRRLGSDRSRERQIILITDGEPNAFDHDGSVVFENPATERSVNETLAEVVRVTRDRTAITTFLLAHDDALEEFVTQLTRINRGRVVQSDPETLGRYLVRDFATRRQQVVV